MVTNADILALDSNGYAMKKGRKKENYLQVIWWPPPPCACHFTDYNVLQQLQHLQQNQ